MFSPGFNRVLLDMENEGSTKKFVESGNVWSSRKSREEITLSQRPFQPLLSMSPEGTSQILLSSFIKYSTFLFGTF